jgi:hypothetical protein
MAGAPVSRDFGGYGAILRDARAIDDAERSRLLVDCPLCGEPLDKNARGELNCSYGHYQARPGAVRYGT